ncbi:MAG: glutathione S-transferase family protein [Pseudomonadota bacterium]
MEPAQLFYVDGSPFARLCRALILDWGLPVQLVEVAYPLEEAFFEENPLGQVPLLKTVGENIFPTLQIAEQLWAMTEEASVPTFDPLADRQMLTVILSMGDALVASAYQEWAGLEQTKPSKIGFDPGARNLERAQRTLDWIEAQAGDWLCGDEVSVADYALASILLWSESRREIKWKGRKKILRIVEEVSHGENFASTAPGPWVPPVQA